MGVCFATSGPGATNLTTGIATAYMDSSPVVFITCNVAQSLLGKDAFQEVDITGIAMPITKATYHGAGRREARRRRAAGLCPRRQRPARPGASSTF